MISNITPVLLVLLYLISATGPGAFIAYPGMETTIMIKNDKIVASELAEQNRLAEEERLKKEAEEEHNRLYTPLEFERADLTNYAVVYLPKSHFTLKSNNKGDTLSYIYLDDISTLKLSSKQKITEEISPDTASSKLCGMGENYKAERVETANLEIYRCEASSTENEIKHVCWYAVRANSILLADANISPNTDYEAFKNAVEIALDKSNIYYVSDYVFKVPTTGYYSQFIQYEVQGDNPVNENSNNEETNEQSQKVTQTSTGIIDTDEISDDWKDMKIKLDGNIIQVPCKLSNLLDYGYNTVDSLDNIADKVVEIGVEEEKETEETEEEKTEYNSEEKENNEETNNDSEENQENSEELINKEENINSIDKQYIFNKGYKEQIYLAKQNGVTIKVTVENDTDNDIELKDLTVNQIKISRNDFGKYTYSSKYTDMYLPELIYVGGATWNISADGFLKILNTRNVYKIEQSSGGYKVGTSSADKEIEVLTDGYSNITDIRLTIK